MRRLFFQNRKAGRFLQKKSQAKTLAPIRTEGESLLRMYQTYTLKADRQTAAFQDKQVLKGKWHQYRIQAIAPDGSVSKFSQVIRIKF